MVKAVKRLGGRPSHEQAELIEGHILDIATKLFLKQGYGATSIEAVSQAAGISKRTFYHRFEDKAALFSAVMHRFIEQMRPAARTSLLQGKTVEEKLEHIAHIILKGALKPEAIAMHRMIIAEVTRFPELAKALDGKDARRDAMEQIATLLQTEYNIKNALFAAEQFFYMLVSIPQRKALGLGTALSEAQVKEWVKDTVSLFLQGCKY